MTGGTGKALMNLNLFTICNHDSRRTVACIQDETFMSLKIEIERMG